MDKQRLLLTLNLNQSRAISHLISAKLNGSRLDERAQDIIETSRTALRGYTAEELAVFDEYIDEQVDKGRKARREIEQHGYRIMPTTVARKYRT
jgi:hypothetical protein